MPKTLSTRLAVSPSLTARINGMPPATAASKASATPRRLASSHSSWPWWASSALFAVTTCLPAASALRMKVRAGSRPPISSTTTGIEGSPSTRLASAVIGSALRSSPSRGRVRSVSATAASVRRQPARSSRFSRRFWRILTMPAPTVPSPSRPIRTSSTRLTRSASQVLEAPQRLANPLLVLDEGEAHVALTVLAEADARRDGHLRVLDEELGEFERAHRAEGLGDRRPHEHRPLGLGDRPAHLVEPVDERVAALAVDLVDLADDRLVALQRDDPGDLDGLEDAVVEIRLDPRERVDHPRISAAEGEAPAGHVVRLRQREELDADVLRAGHLEERGRPVAVEGEVRVGEVVDDHEPVLLRERHDLLEERAVHAHR